MAFFLLSLPSTENQYELNQARSTCWTILKVLDGAESSSEDEIEPEVIENVHDESHGPPHHFLYEITVTDFCLNFQKVLKKLWKFRLQSLILKILLD